MAGTRGESVRSIEDVIAFRELLKNGRWTVTSHGPLFTDFAYIVTRAEMVKS